MRLSVVIPAHNSARTLPATLASVLDQTGVTMDVTVVNDAGDDPAPLLPGDDARVRCVTRAANGGASATRNTGLAATDGEIVHFLDSDDVLAPGLYRPVMEAFADDTVDVLVVGYAYHIEAEAGQEVTRLPAVADLGDVTRLDNERFCHRYERGHNPFLPSFTFFRRSALVAALGPQPWNETLPRCEDTFLYLNLIRSRDIHIAATKGVSYRVRDASLSHSAPIDTWRDLVRATQMFLDIPADSARTTRAQASAWWIRQNAVRRIARIEAQAGRRGAALGLMRRYLWRPFDAKMVAEMLLIAAGRRRP